MYNPVRQSKALQDAFWELPLSLALICALPSLGLGHASERRYPRMHCVRPAMDVTKDENHPGVMYSKPWQL